MEPTLECLDLKNSLPTLFLSDIFLTVTLQKMGIYDIGEYDFRNDHILVPLELNIVTTAFFHDLCSQQALEEL